jgi:hypothetical protein
MRWNSNCARTAYSQLIDSMRRVGSVDRRADRSVCCINEKCGGRRSDHNNKLHCSRRLSCDWSVPAWPRCILLHQGPKLRTSRALPMLFAATSAPDLDPTVRRRQDDSQRQLQIEPRVVISRAILLFGISFVAKRHVFEISSAPYNRIYGQ